MHSLAISQPEVFGILQVAGGPAMQAAALWQSSEGTNARASEKLHAIFIDLSSAKGSLPPNSEDMLDVPSLL
jgi:hypothetical protein